ncbi:carboxypeptidase C [Rickenella mellea]|uniref:Carboxypeptidase n=1 Tax=Rickenella mellea TaxID=50990 RepID=A0A4Y7QKU9_9AGAM|nr:carboxypeptidase C [Rickenella mellea]
MRIPILPFVSLLAVSLVLAFPTDQRSTLQTVLGDIPKYSNQLEHTLDDAYTKLEEKAKNVLLDIEGTVERWIEDGRSYVKQHGTIFEHFTHFAFNDHAIRITEPTLCDPDVQQYSGYLDVSDGKHLFFWFFESRVSPADAPLILWLNGGPGCSSSTGLLFELGPCSVSDEGKNTTYNPYSWNSHANIIFLDQPVDVGYSYSSDGSTVNTSPAAGEDVYAFLELFLGRFPKYAKAPFHLAAESYGGTYAPNIASVIHKYNKQFASSPEGVMASAPVPPVKHINLASVILANGHTDPLVQMAAIPEFACEGPYPIYDDPNGPECIALRSKVPTCERLVKACYQYESRLACVPAALYCETQLWGEIQKLKLNPYDVRRSCDREKDGALCYKQMEWIDVWMNIPEVKRAVGANPDRTFQSCNMGVNQAFLMQGDAMHNSAKLLPELIEDGIRLLVYAGNADYMCNFIGNEAWMLKLENKYQKEFQAASQVPWHTLDSGKLAGMVRTAGGQGDSAGNVTFVAVHEAGHMVPFDQPEAALDLIERWILNVPLTLNATQKASHIFGLW